MDIDGSRFSQHFLMTEWEQVVDAWQLGSWDAYRDVARLGRKTRLQEKQRAALWSIFERVRSGLKSRGLITYSELFIQLASKLASNAHSPFEFAVIDEAQDVGVGQLRFLAALRVKRPNGIFFWRSGAADFPTAILMEITRRRRSRPVVHAADQLPDLPSDPKSGRSSARPRTVGCGRHNGETSWHGFDV
jgi:hypothetical protein